MKLIVLSDVHGNILHCQDVALRNPGVNVLQLGDLGAGFVPRETIENLPSNFSFFPGNHDNRKVAVSMSNCQGNYGVVFNQNIFFVSGADSIDKDRRTPGVNWWRDEELTYEQCQYCLDAWKQSKASVLITHDCPQAIAESCLLIYDRSRTRQLLDAMIEARKPQLVVFGHHHRAVTTVRDGVKYIGLKIDETITLDISDFGVTVSL